MAFYNFDGISIEGAIATADKGRWANKRFIKKVFHYVFNENGCRRIHIRVDESNTEALEMDRRLGFVEEGRLRQAADDGGDVLVMGMLRSECKWLDDGQENTESASAA